MNERVINGYKIDDNTRFEYTPNPKRPGFKSYNRYKMYEGSTTMEEYMENTDKKYRFPDLRYDEEHGFLKLFDGDVQINDRTEKEDDKK